MHLIIDSHAAIHRRRRWRPRARLQPTTWWASGNTSSCSGASACDLKRVLHVCVGQLPCNVPVNLARRSSPVCVRACEKPPRRTTTVGEIEKTSNQNIEELEAQPESLFFSIFNLLVCARPSSPSPDQHLNLKSSPHVPLKKLSISIMPPPPPPFHSTPSKRARAAPTPRT